MLDAIEIHVQGGNGGHGMARAVRRGGAGRVANVWMGYRSGANRRPIRVR